MRTLFFLLIAGVANLAGAADEAYLIPVKNVTVMIDDGPSIAAVQPTAYIKVTVSSCGQRSLVAQKEKQGDIIYISILDTKMVDCRAKAVERTYQMQISSDASREQYVILNPIKPVYVRN